MFDHGPLGVDGGGITRDGKKSWKFGRKTSFLSGKEESAQDVLIWSRVEWWHNETESASSNSQTSKFHQERRSRTFERLLRFVHFHSSSLWTLPQVQVELVNPRCCEFLGSFGRAFKLLARPPSKSWIGMDRWRKSWSSNDPSRMLKFLHRLSWIHGLPFPWASTCFHGLLLCTCFESLCSTLLHCVGMCWI